MGSSYPVLPSRPIIPHISTTCPSCNTALEFPVPNPNPRPATLLHIRCFQCHTTLSHAFYPAQIPSGTNSGGGDTRSGAGTNNHRTSGQAAPTRKGRKIGTQERPLETGYYDILGVPVTATTDDVKKAYSNNVTLLTFAGINLQFS
jgi:hypothetical protein